MIKKMHNVTVVLSSENPYVTDCNKKILLSDYYKFRPMKQKFDIKLSKNFKYKKMFYIPCENNIYHSTVFSAFYLPFIPQDSLVLTNNSNTFKFYANHFKIKLISETGYYDVETIYYFDLFSPVYTIPSRFDTFALSLFLKSTRLLCTNDSNLSKFLYIKRKSPYRNIQNGNDFEQSIISKGFSVVYMEDYTLYSQINMFFNAKFIIAVHGAGLTNIIYCKPDCAIIELKHKGMNKFLIHNCYAQLAKESHLTNYNMYFSQYTSLSNCKSKDYNLSIDVNTLSIYIDNLLKSI